MRCSKALFDHLVSTGEQWPIDVGSTAAIRRGNGPVLQLPFPQVSESMGNHDSKIVDAASVD
jgi:hypothetical protein